VITALSAFVSRPSFGFCKRRSPELELIALRHQVIVRPVRCRATTLLSFWLQEKCDLKTTIVSQRTMLKRTSMEIRLIADAYNIQSRGQAWLVSFTARGGRQIRRVNKVYSEQPFMLCRSSAQTCVHYSK
jgi:hypothetical protein